MAVKYYAARAMKIGHSTCTPGDVIDVTGWMGSALQSKVGDGSLIPLDETEDIKKVHPELFPSAVSTEKAVVIEEVEAVPEKEQFNPSDYTIDVVLEYVKNNPDELEEVMQAEKFGSNRTTLISALASQVNQDEVEEDDNN